MKFIRIRRLYFLKKYSPVILKIAFLLTATLLTTGCLFNNIKSAAINVDGNKGAIIPLNVISSSRSILPLNSYTDYNVDDDLWDRIRLGLSWDLDKSYASINEEIKYLLKTGYCNKISQRAKFYLHFIVEEVEKRNLPMELALMPVVESSFDPKAVSPAGAAGLWQIMPYTGEYFGLLRNSWYDGRYDIIAATHAALNYMEHLYAIFNDWELALAAFNSGPARVRSAIAKNKLYGKKTDFWHLQLPKETSKYVTKLVAISKILRQPQSYGVNFGFLKNSPNIALITVKDQFDLKDIAEKSEIPLQTLLKINPGLLRHMTPPDNNYILIVPAEKRDLVVEKIVGGELYKPHQIYQQHIIKKNDSLTKIAKLYNTSVKEIKLINNMSNDKIIVGKSLSIPERKNSQPILDNSSNNKDAAKNSQKSDQPTNSKILHLHKIKKGDSLWSIAKKYDITVNDLIKWNNINSDAKTLKIGVNLSVWK